MNRVVDDCLSAAPCVNSGCLALKKHEFHLLNCNPKMTVPVCLIKQIAVLDIDSIGESGV